MTSAFLTSPLEVLKARLQSDFYQAQLVTLRAAHPTTVSSSVLLRLPYSGYQHFRETFQIVLIIHKYEGWRALFKGLGLTLTRGVPARAINFYPYVTAERRSAHHSNGGQG